jgi:nucleoside-diphosphate-sugar epimerase
LKRVLVTGASGFIGRHLIPALTGKGIEVVAVSRDKAGEPNRRIEYRSADVIDGSSIRGVMDGCDTVVHLAGLAHRVGESLTDDDFDRINVDGTRNVLAEGGRSGVQRFLFMSSALVGGSSSVHPLTEEQDAQPTDPYARSKARAEQLVAAVASGGCLWTGILRPPMVYGPGNRGNLPRLASLIKRRVPLPFGAVPNARSVVFVSNLVHAIILLLERQPGLGDIYYVADDVPLSTADLAREIGAALGTPARIVAVPPSVLRALARFGDAIASVAPFPFTTRELNKLTGTLVVDDSKLRGATGYAPLISTRAGIRESFQPAYTSAGPRSEGDGAGRAGAGIRK